MLNTSAKKVSIIFCICIGSSMQSALAEEQSETSDVQFDLSDSSQSMSDCAPSPWAAVSEGLLVGPKNFSLRTVPQITGEPSKIAATLSVNRLGQAKLIPDLINLEKASVSDLKNFWGDPNKRIGFRELGQPPKELNSKIYNFYFKGSEEAERNHNVTVQLYFRNGKVTSYRAQVSFLGKTKWTAVRGETINASPPP